MGRFAVEKVGSERFTIVHKPEEAGALAIAVEIVESAMIRLPDFDFRVWDRLPVNRDDASRHAQWKAGIARSPQ